MHEMELVAVRVELPSNAPIVLLQEVDGLRRTLPIFIGAAEATSIAIALEGETPPRPMTHDLMVTLLEESGVSASAIAITEISDRTFYAELTMHQGDREFSVSCRPSDGVAVAVRLGLPIFASDQVLDDAGIVDDAASTDDNLAVEEFREFLDSVNPEDFEA